MAVRMITCMINLNLNVMIKFLSKISLVAAIFILFQNCASNKVVNDPSGSWEFKITGTPYGEIKGTMTITSGANGFVAKMKAMGDELEMNPMGFDAKTGKATGTFSFQGNSVQFDAIHASGSMNGSLSAGGADFPFQAVKATAAGTK